MKPCFQLKRGRAGRNERLVGGEGGSRGRSEGETERLGKGVGRVEGGTEAKKGDLKNRK